METLKSVNQWTQRTVSHSLMFTGSNFIRFAKRKLDEYVFLGNQLQVLYAPHFESLSDTKEKLECRRTEVLPRLNPGRSQSSTVHIQGTAIEPSWVAAPSQINSVSQQLNSDQRWNSGEFEHVSHAKDSLMTTVSSDRDYFPSQSMNQTVQLVRERLDKIHSSSKCLETEPASKKTRVDNRRRI
ncbi:uncharacterized protein LOC131145120 isoform X2 [Malania oleifera]|uniref:uncharacterized protein LOC131145120 isoform X2 n=1 Tax=Malania oleifera TaxID=397392 RepID=UPI0025AE199B|nr:uncharacterized protein LOC131145120 isoform X2 [Malania oleifera]